MPLLLDKQKDSKFSQSIPSLVIVVPIHSQAGDASPEYYLALLAPMECNVFETTLRNFRIVFPERDGVDKYYGIFMDLCGSLWIFVDLCGSLWIFWEVALAGGSGSF
jgi:hypothetical protein